MAKKLQLLKLSVILTIATMTFNSCFVEVCVLCIEEDTEVIGEYCGSPTEAKQYEDDLKRQGTLQNQKWNCTRI